MSNKEIKTRVNNLLAQAFAPSQLLITASDQIRVQRVISALLNKFYPDQTTVTKLNATDWEQSTYQTIITALQSPGLFSPACLVILTNISELSAAELEQVAKCLEYTGPSAALWLTGKSLNKASKFRKAFEKSDSLIDFPNLTGLPLKNWINKEALQAGLSEMSENIVSAVIQVSDSALDQISAIIEHLALYSNNGKISPKEFGLLYPDAPEENEFALLDLIHTGSSAFTSQKITKTFQEGKNAFMLLGLIARSYSRYVAIRTLLDSGQTLQQARELLAMQEWPFKKHLEVVSKKSLGRLHTDIEALLLADSKLKNRSLGETEIFCELADSLRTVQ